MTSSTAASNMRANGALGQPAGSPFAQRVAGRHEIAQYARSASHRISHIYRFMVRAPRIEKFELPPDASATMVGFMIHFCEMGRATFEANYWR